MWKGLWMPRGEREEQAQDRQGMPFVLALPGEQGQAQEGKRGRRVAGRDRRVLEVLASDRKLSLVGRRCEETASFGILEALNHRVGEAHRLVIPACLERGLI